MKKVGPELEQLTHRLAECPEEFFAAPITIGPDLGSDPSAVDLAAIVADHFRDLSEALIPEAIDVSNESLAKLTPGHQRLIAIAIWLLRDEWFLSQQHMSDPTARLLIDRLRGLAETIRPETTVSDVDRREELVRFCLRELGYRPAGETIEQASDRLNTLDSVERLRVVRKTRDAEARARRIREEMARKRAEEAAARYSPE